jgi:hypothetical protein
LRVAGAHRSGLARARRYNECIGDEVDAEVGWDDSASDSQSNGCTTPSNSSLDSSYNGGSASQSFVMPNSVEHMLLSPNY